MDKIDELMDGYLVAINGFGKPDIARAALRAEYDRLRDELSDTKTALDLTQNPPYTQPPELEQ